MTLKNKLLVAGTLLSATLAIPACPTLLILAKSLK